MFEYFSVRIIAYSSKKLSVERHLRRKECLVHPLDDHIRILPLLDSIETTVVSSMTWRSQTASFLLKRTLQGIPLAHPQLFKLLGLQKMMPF